MIEEVDALLRRDGAAATIAAVAWLGPAIDADAAAGRFDLWARSTAVDENTGGPVLAPAVFEALHARAGLPARWPVGNAGLLHVYGYLLSTTPTPYGLKRQRWLGGELARACGLPADAFVPWGDDGASGTPLQRATAALTSLFARAPLFRERVDGITGVTALGEPGSGGAAPLGYALEAPDRRFVTLFPVADPAAVLHDVTTGSPRLRWNAAR